MAQLTRKFDIWGQNCKRSLWLYVFLLQSKMQSQNYKSFLLSALLSVSGTSGWIIGIDKASAANSDKNYPLAREKISVPPLLNFQEEQSPPGIKLQIAVPESEGNNPLLPDFPGVYAQSSQNEESLATPSDPPSTNNSTNITPQNEQSPTPANPPSPNNANNATENEPPPVEGQGQPTEFPATPPSDIERKLETLEQDQPDKIKRLRWRLEKEKLNFDELGVLVLRQLELSQNPPPLETPPQPQPPKEPIIKPKPRPTAYLLGRLGYFQTSNIFSSDVDPIEDGLVFSGLTLAAAPIRLGRGTYLTGSVDGYLIKYLDQSQFNYNQFRANLGIYQQINRRMYGEIGWNHQQLFYAQDSDDFNFDAGDRFLNENSFRLAFGRRDRLTSKLMLNSFYELRLSFADPETRNRVINFGWLSLNYQLQKPLQVGLDYQFNWSNFTQRDRQDQYHRFYGHLNYRMSKYGNLSFQGGVALGDSTEDNIDFDGWFFSVNYNVELGQF